MEIKCMYKPKILLFWRFYQTAGLFCVSKTLTKESKGIKIILYKILVLYVMRMEIHQRNTSLYLNLKWMKKFDCVILN